MHRLREMLPYSFLCDDIFETEVASIEGANKWLMAELFGVMVDIYDI
jgi:hypothetical protein